MSNTQYMNVPQPSMGNSPSIDIPNLASAEQTFDNEFAQRAVNITWYGADHIGVGDSTTAIQNAINSGRPVYVPNGTFIVTAPILVKDGTQIFGNGVNSYIKGNGSFNAIFQNVHGTTISATVITQISIKNLVLTQTSGSSVLFGIDTTNISYSVFDNIETNGFSDTGLYLNHTSATYNTFSNIITKNNVNDGFRLENNANSSRLYGCTITNNGRFGIYCNSDGLETLEVIGGSVESSGLSGIHLDGRGCLIAGVHIEGNGESAQVATYGIEFQSGLSYTDNAIVGCFFYGNGQGPDHNTHVMNCPAGSTPQIVLSAGSPSQKYIDAGEMVMPDGYGYYGQNKVGTFSQSGQLFLQTQGSGYNAVLKGFGGYAVGLSMNGQATYNPDGSMTYAGTGHSWSFGTQAPTAGNYTQGHYVKNTAPTVQGTAGSQYIVRGWVCTVSGNSATGPAATFVEDRGLTGT